MVVPLSLLLEENFLFKIGARLMHQPFAHPRRAYIEQKAENAKTDKVCEPKSFCQTNDTALNPIDQRDHNLSLFESKSPYLRSFA